MPITDGQIQPGLALVGNRQIIRASEYLSQVCRLEFLMGLKIISYFQPDLLFTGGESGCLSVWKPGPDKVGSNAKKAAKARSKQKHKPY